MLHLPTPTQNATRVRPSRRRWGSYRRSIEQRAAAAAIMIKDGWGPEREAAGLFSVCPTYVALARKLSDADRGRLARGELKLAALWQNYRRRLAERSSAKREDFARFGAREDAGCEWRAGSRL